MTDEEREWQTRKSRIDPKLRALGWSVMRYRDGLDPASLTHHAIGEYETDNGPADYALFVDGRVVGVIEAKKLSLGPQEVLIQAERYARGIRAKVFDYDGLRVPFVYSTNGEVVWHRDVRHSLNRSRKIADFHTPDALREFLQEDFAARCEWFQANPIQHPRIRDYQTKANLATELAITERKRHMLLAMATGTGKTFTMVHQVYRLMKSGVASRILFLVDRRALAAQAVRTFASFEPEPGLKFDKIYEVYSQRFRREDLEGEKFDPKVLPSKYLLDPQPGYAFVYVCTIQRMAINLFGRGTAFNLGDEEADEDADRLDIPIHAFDVIIADECHRGYTSQELSVWRNTLEHFDAIKIGLTATPAAHTTTYFKDVVFRYTYEQAVQDGYLVDYNAVKISSDVRINGIFLNEGEQVDWVDTQTGQTQPDLLEDERAFDTTEIEQRVTAPDSNRKILQEVYKHALQHQQDYGRFPKILIFAVNDIPQISHTDQLVGLARDIFGRGDAFVQKITGQADRPLQLIREFRNRPNPGVVVTVDMLSTGVDIPDLEFVVFLRPVKSRILWDQMLGRGTRKGEKYPDKSHFVVFDCFDGTLLRYFKEVSAFTVVPPDKPSRSIKEVIEDIWNNRDRDYNTRCLVKRLQRINKEMSGEARDMFKAYIPDGDVEQFARNLRTALRQNFTETMKLLRNPNFQDLLVNYPRAPREFLIAHQTEDTVSSEWLIRDDLGNEHKPEDYLEEFARFVRENPDQIEAIVILLERPQDWSTDAIDELRQKLSGAPQRFTVENLQKAHAAHYRKALVDIISMIKHAAKEEEPLLTAAERVDRALQTITSNREFTEEQARWLNLIRQHLVENLSIDKEDFDNMPIFTRDGGWAPADKLFHGKLNELLRMMNEAVAA